MAEKGYDEQLAQLVAADIDGDMAGQIAELQGRIDRLRQTIEEEVAHRVDDGSGGGGSGGGGSGGGSGGGGDGGSGGGDGGSGGGGGGGGGGVGRPQEREWARRRLGLGWARARADMGNVAAAALEDAAVRDRQADRQWQRLLRRADQRDVGFAVPLRRQQRQRRLQARQQREAEEAAWLGEGQWQRPYGMAGQQREAEEQARQQREAEEQARQQREAEEQARQQREAEEPVRRGASMPTA